MTFKYVAGLPISLSLWGCRRERRLDPRGRVAVYARANTWINDAMRRPDQLPLPAVPDLKRSGLRMITGLIVRAREEADGSRAG